jgi:hypothetical protein
MKTRFLLLACIFSCAVPLSAQEPPVDENPALNFGENGPTAEEVLRLARYSQALQNHDLDGYIRPSGISFTKVPFKLTLMEKQIHFSFYEDNKTKNGINQRISLDLKDNRYILREIVKGKNEELPLSRYAEKVRDTPITYEDLSMRFLYWPDPVKGPDEKAIKGRMAWVVNIKNPLPSGPYARMRVWVDQGSGALAKIEGYNKDNKLVKEFEVRKIQRGGNETWVLKEMRVTGIDPETGKREETVMEIEDPKDR